MKKIFIAVLSLLLTLCASAQEITGTWSGTLKVTPQTSLKLVFNISPDAVTIDSPDQNAFGIEGQLKYLSSDSVNIAVPSLMMDYSGKLIEGSILGQFRQGIFTTPLFLSPGVKKANRPQTPHPPFPYSTEEVTVQAPEAMLSGNLTVPQNATKDTPVVVLVSGSGLQNRDEELFEHKPFAVIADFLARNGIASLRYDDRGCGESKGDSENATTADFAEDAKAVVEYLRNSDRFSKVGLIGHSEGGIIAYMLGAKPNTLDFIVSIAGPSVSGAEINAFQNKMALINSGVDPKTAEQFAEALLKANLYRLNNPPVAAVNDALLSEIYPQHAESMMTQKLSETIVATLSMEKIQPWMEYFLKTDPASDMRKLEIPTMIIYGEKDMQVPPSLNLEPAKNNAPKANVKCYPDLNHMMQHAQTGSLQEYKEIEETFSPEVLSDIMDFINLLQKPSKFRTSVFFQAFVDLVYVEN